jgi:hypothetical protein
MVLILYYLFYPIRFGESCSFWSSEFTISRIGCITQILHDISDKTKMKYWNSFKQWEIWAVNHGLSALPALGDQFALFLTHKLNTVKTVSSLDSIVVGVNWVHNKIK